MLFVIYVQVDSNYWKLLDTDEEMLKSWEVESSHNYENNLKLSQVIFSHNYKNNLKLSQVIVSHN